MTPEEREALLLRWMQEGDPIAVEFDPFMAFTLIGYLQLALRHPSAGGSEAAAIIRIFIRGLQDRFPPAVAVLSREGDNPENDVCPNPLEPSRN